ncbi:SART-1 protein [Spinellus fusiger]|nr:SART-1 protein [Spinellus fusiger]
MADSLSLEETNALRLKLGLPAIEQSEGVIDADQEAFDNFQTLKSQHDKEAKAAEIKERIEKSKNRKKNLEKLKGKGLGEEDGEDSALDWIRKSRQREKALAVKRAKELEEMDASFAVAYDAAHLSGLKIAHDIEEFNVGSEMILTLKDKNILSKRGEGEEGNSDDDDDELTNVQLEDKERLQKNLDNKKKKPTYNPYDDDEFVMGGAKKSVLPQYEDEEERKGFSIGSSGMVVLSEEGQDERSVSEKLKAQTLAYEKMQEIKDYYTQEEINLTFKKTKKKKMRKRVVEEKEKEEGIDESNKQVETSTTTQSPPLRETQRLGESNFVDDDDLQEALSRARRAANKQKQKLIKKMSPEEIARSIAENRETPEENEPESENGLVLSQTSEFVNSLGNMPAFIREPLQREIAIAPQPEDQPVQEVRVKQHKEMEEGEALEEDPSSEATSYQEIEPTETTEPTDQNIGAVMEEPLISSGIASTLSLLSQKGFITKPTEGQLLRDRQAAEQIRWQNEAKKREYQRERERERDRERERIHNRESNRGRENDRERIKEREREREREKEAEERERLREFEKRMANYRPNVKLEYVDEHGRQMNTKEAFRFMSHKFHGKTSGKTKTEKRLQKVEEEMKLNMMSSTDTPLNLASALLEKQQRSGAAHVVLSIGNRGVVPSEPASVDLERPEEVKKTKTKKRPAHSSDHGEESSRKRR